MQTCEFNSMLDRYHDGELPPMQRRAMDEHLQTCLRCAARIEYMQTMSQALRVGVAEVLPRASSEFMARLEGLAINVERQTVLRFVTRLTAAAAAVLAIATVLWAANPWANHARLAQSPQSTASVVLGPEERVVLDPQSADAASGNDATAAVDSQFDFLSQALSGGQP